MCKKVFNVFQVKDWVHRTQTAQGCEMPQLGLGFNQLEEKVHLYV